MGNFANAQETNLLSGWDGGSNTTAPSNFGWSSSKGKSFNALNATSGMRITTTYSGYKLEDGSSYSYSSDSDLSSKVFWIRYNDSGESFTYTFTGLEPGETYFFTGLIGWHNNSNAPTVKTTIYAGDEKLAEISKGISKKTTMYKISQAFKVPADCSAENYELSFSANQTGDCMVALSAFSLTQLTGSEASPVDITSSLKNPSFEGSGSTSGGAINAPQDWTMNCSVNGWVDGTINTTAPSDGSKCYNLWAGTVTSTDMNQTITLPAGKYLLSADFRIDNMDYVNDQGVYATVDGKTYKSTETITTVANPWNSQDGWNTISTYFYVLDDEASVKIGASSTGTNGPMGWYQIDNFRLKFCGKQQLMFADNLSGTAESDKWYKLAVALDGDYNITSSEDATIYYSQNGELVDADVTESVDLSAETPTTLSLTAGTLYVKSNVATTIALSASSYSYTLGEATVNPANNAYIQNGLISITFPNAVANDPAATLALVTGAKATVGTEEIELEAIENGFKFNIGELAKGTNYEVSIPAEVFGYAGNAMNEAIFLTFHTPAIFDGVYYVYSPVTEKFTSRGNDWKTSVTVDEYGIAMRVSTDEDNYTIFNLVDANLYWGLNDWMYTDKSGGDTGKYNVSSVEDGYTILNTNNTKNVYVYLKEDGSKFRVAGNAIKGDNYTDDAQIVWQFKTPAEHAAIISSYKDTQATTAAAAAAIDGVTTKAELETAVVDYGTANVTITTPSSVLESFQFGGGVDVYDESVSGLKPGLYKLTVEAFTRLTDYENTNIAKQGGYEGTTSYIYANDAKTQICSVMDEPATTGDNGWWSKDGNYYPNNTTAAGQAFDNGSYKNEVWVYVAADAGEETGTLNYGIKEPGKCENNNWLCYRKFTLTYYSNNKADDDDYAALADAIKNVEDTYVLGFEKDEYAPYNNIAALEALAVAKAINPDELNEKSAVNDAATALTNATWTANTEEVNAVYDGSFNLTTKTDGKYILPIGWTNLGYNTRVYNSSNMESNAGVNATSKTATMFAKFTTEYGTEAGYTMPLKKGVYYLSFIYGGWNEKGAREIKVYNAADNTISATVTPPSVTAKDSKAHTTTSSWSTYSGLVEIPEDGDYILSFYRGNTSSQNQICISDIELKKAASANMKIYADVKWGTFVAPFAVAIPKDVEAYKCTEVVDGVITTEFVEGTAIPANTPVLVYSKTDVDEPFYGKAVAIEGDPTCGVLVGTYEAKAAPVGSYVLQKNDGVFSFYKVVSGAQPTVGANRCYLSTSSSSTVLRFGGVTGIQSMEQQGESVIYDLTGRRVDAAVKGIYIVGGKKMLVK